MMRFDLRIFGTLIKKKNMSIIYVINAIRESAVTEDKK